MAEEYNIADILESVFAHRMKNLKVEDLLDHYKSGRKPYYKEPKKKPNPKWMTFLKERGLGSYNTDLPF